MSHGHGGGEGDPSPSAERGAEARRLDIASHIFAVSATLVGVCLTVITLMQLFERLSAWSAIADDLLSVNALLFLSACTSAYSAMRAREARWRGRLERLADVLFLAALLLMTAICGIITYALV